MPPFALMTWSLSFWGFFERLETWQRRRKSIEVMIPSTRSTPFRALSMLIRPVRCTAEYQTWLTRPSKVPSSRFKFKFESGQAYYRLLLLQLPFPNTFPVAELGPGWLASIIVLYTHRNHESTYSNRSPFLSTVLLIRCWHEWHDLTGP